MKCLLIDDDQMVGISMARLFEDLTDSELSVTAVTTLGQADETLANESFDLIFLDVEFEGESSGLEYLQKLKERGLTVPVIMLSNRNTQAVVDDAIDKGAHGFLPKQESPDALEDALRSIKQGAVYFPSLISNRKTPEITWADAATLGLTPREYEALFYLVKGLLNKTIATDMGIAEYTVADHLTKAFNKLGLKSGHGRKGVMALLTEKNLHLRTPKPTPKKAAATT